MVRKPWSEVVENVSGISVSCQQQNSFTGTAPIEYFEVNARLNFDEMNRVFGRIFPIRCMPFRKTVEQQRSHERDS